jgi:hypothetical protein
MRPLLPSPDWYERYWYSPKPAPSRTSAILTRWLAWAAAPRRGWSDRRAADGRALSAHRRQLYHGALECFPTPFLYAEALGRLG